jgi:AGCS family alanine or glycine:cation symporter
VWATGTLTRPGRIEVSNGALLGGGLVHLKALVEDARLMTDDGRAWSGSLNVGPDGAISVVDGAAPTVDGKVLLTGAPLTAHGFKKALPGKWGDNIVTLAVLLFAVSTAISWSYYGDRATEYLFGPRWIKTYRWIYLCFFFLGAILPLSAVWTFGDVALGLMSFPNLLALILLSGATASLSKDYFSRDHKPYK